MILSSKTRKLRAEAPMEEQIAHQCRDGIGPNTLIDIDTWLYIYAPQIWGGGTFANILPGGDVCQLLFKIQPKAVVFKTQ